MRRKLTTDRHVATQAQKHKAVAGHCDARNRRAAFTLTEVVVASALLITAIVPILKALTSVHVYSVIIERKTRSLTLAQTKLDEIKARSVYNYTGNYTVLNESLTGAYLCTIKDTALSANLRRIDVSVGYDTDSDASLADDEVFVLLETLIARRW